MSPYCVSRFQTVRRLTHEVKVGAVGVGGANPVRIQSMTTSDTQDIAATVRQSIALAEVGCEIVRITAPTVAAAQCLRPIREQFTAAGFGHIPLVADIHFLPSAAMEAVEHVEKVRVNPGNYADKKKFAVRDYTDADYDRDCACRSVRRRDAKLTQNGGVKRKALTIPPPGSILRAESDRNSLHAVGETDLSHQALA